MYQQLFPTRYRKRRSDYITLDMRVNTYIWLLFLFFHLTVIGTIEWHRKR
jgi:hypothetical protein